jgi:hypothetical protein
MGSGIGPWEDALIVARKGRRWWVMSESFTLQRAASHKLLLIESWLDFSFTNKECSILKIWCSRLCHVPGMSCVLDSSHTTSATETLSRKYALLWRNTILSTFPLFPWYGDCIRRMFWYDCISFALNNVSST